MLEPLRAWLNGSKEYNTGVALYGQLGSNTALLNLFVKGPTDFTRRRLQEELLSICNRLKSTSNDNPGTPAENISRPAVPYESHTRNQLPQGHNIHKVSDDLILEQKREEQPVNAVLYDATLQQANKLYKETMNNRAVLLGLANAEDFTDLNTEAKINTRAKLALSVVIGWEQTSALYDKAKYVKEHGRLPDQEDKQDENEYEHLPEHLVKQTLDNLRKNVNKMKKREQTPERVALQQKHEVNIEKLLKRWHSLK